ncbi:gamma-glutamyltransferase family protein [Pigmentiphaga sp.]|uniref:gamma-glutamyltransferase family protein n=1 Tax=Pigmentiphaga sp. TaxID=1977564 RepID=UPI0025CC2240|nr:gamma-glutamyltransferase family protein [Pigmentiphaga sp.]
MPVLADHVVATSQPLAAQAGLAMMARGGNAVDAAIAAAAVLTVVEPVMNGLGGDTQVALWDGAALRGLVGCGRSPRAWSAERFAGRARMPAEGWESVTVPGGVSAWVELARHGAALPLRVLMAPAIRYAREGYAVSPNVARLWASQVARLRGQPGFAEAFLPGGRAPLPGERVRLPELGATLARIADSDGEDFYRGETAGRLAAHAREQGGAMTAEDLAAHRAQWVEPLHMDYRDVRVHELPPASQGMAVLIALGILRHFEMGPATAPDQRAHLQIEAMKMAFADVYAHVADPACMDCPAGWLLEPGYLARRARELSPGRAAGYGARPLPGGGTVYLAAADRDGRMVSLIQSNFQGFGSGVVVPGTGVSLNNRGSGFVLDPRHPNAVAGGKKPFHTIIPAMLSRAGRPLAALGVVGANMQPQGQLQIICALADLGLNPQAALDMPRWRIDDSGQLRLEAAFDPAVAQALADRGHPVQRRAAHEHLDFGGAQLVMRTGAGYLGASEPRRDGLAAGF